MTPVMAPQGMPMQQQPMMVDPVTGKPMEHDPDMAHGTPVLP